MKIVRILAVGVAAVFLLVALLVGAAFLPAVQRWAVLQAAAKQPGLQLQIDRFSALPGSVTVRKLQLTWQGTRVALADASIGFSFWEAVAHRRLVIGTVRVAGLQVDLTGAVPGATPSTAAPAVDVSAAPVVTVLPSGPAAPAFDGVFKYLRFPLEVRMDQCLVEAEAVFPQSAKRPPGRVRLKLSGGHFAPGQEARFDFDASIQNPDPGAPVDTVLAHGAVTAKLGTVPALESLGLKIEAEARGPRLAQPTRLQAEVVLARTSKGENYTVTLNSVDGTAASRLLSMQVDYVAGGSQLTGQWAVSATDRQLAPFAMGIGLPEFSATGEGRFELNPAALKARLVGQLTGRVARLAVLDARLATYDGLSTATSFDVEYGARVVRVTDFTARFDAQKPVLSLRAIQPFSLDLASHRLVAADPAKDLVQVKIEGVPIAWAKPWLPADVAVTGNAVTGEWTVALRGERIWLHPVAPLRVRKLAVSQAGRVLLPASDISLDAAIEHDKDQTRVTLGGLVLQTAAGDRIETTGEFSYRPDGNPMITAQAAVDATLPTMLASLLPDKAWEVHGTLALTQTANTVQVDKLGLRVLVAGNHAFMDLSSAEPFRVDTGRRQITTVTGRPGEILRVKLIRIPLRELRRYLGVLDLAGDLAASEFVVTSGEGKLHLAPVAPLRVEKLSVANAGQALVKGLTIELEPAVDYSDQGIAVKVNALRVRTAGGGNLLSAQTEVTMEPDFARPRLKGTASFDLSVAQLAEQPALAGFQPLGQGKLVGEGKFSFDQNLLGEGRITLNGFVSPATHEPLPVVNLSFRAGLAENGDIAVQAPLLIDRAGERSDLTLTATVHRQGGDRTIDAKITGDHLVIDDVLALARAFTPPPADDASKSPPPARHPETANQPATAAPAAPPVATKAEWSGLTGQAALNVKSIVYGKEFEISGLTGHLAVDPTKVTVEKLSGRLGPDGQVSLNAGVGFKAGDPTPYSSKVDLTVQDFEVGPVFKAMAPDQPPTIEGRFNVRSQNEGTGRTLEELMTQTRGEFVLQSRKGVFRGLRQAASMSKTAGLMSGAASVVSGAARLFGGLGLVDANKAESVATQATRTAASTKEAQELGAALAELQFDQLNARLKRDQSLNIRLSEFTVVSPIVRLQGDGQITHQAGKSIFDQPLQVRVNMSVMGSVQSLISRINSSLLTGEKDELGYAKLREPFVIGGTLDKPDTSKLYSLLF